VDPYLLETFAGLETIRLGPLSHAASSDLLRQLRPESADEATLEPVLSTAGGNPLFIREYAKLAGDVSGETPHDSTIPTTIQNIFLATVQRFPRESRELLRKLAVFVHSFTLEDAEYLQERTDADPGMAREAIAAFERADILIREETIFLFTHEVFKQALYNSILNHNKRILHKVIADRMRAFPNPHTGRLLHHLSRAEEWDDVRSLLQDAPDGAYNMEYLGFYDTLLENLDPDDHSARTYLLFRKCTILFNNGNSERADSILKDILRVATTHRLAGAAANAYHILTAYNAKAYALEKAYFCGRKALYYYEQLPDTVQARRNVLKLLSLAELLRNRHEESQSFLSELDALCPKADAEQISAYGERSILSGEYARAQEVLRDVIDDDSTELENYRLGHLFLALMASWFACDFESVTQVSDRLFRGKHRHHGYRAQAIAEAAGARFLLGDSADAENRIQQAEFETYQIRNDFDRVDALRTIAEVCLIIGLVDKAEATAREGIAIGLRHSAYFPTFTLLLLLVEINVDRGDAEAARFFLEEASFLVELQPMLRNRDLILYHYFAAKLDFDDAPDEHRARALEHLETERRNIGNPVLFQNLLRQRCFGAIAGEMEGQPALPRS
jgi:tetratricopeptide (TPR) repeat protein